MLVAAAREEGPGRSYLIQHSAGSGKSKSIGWLAHRLAILHDAVDRKVVASVIVVTDRTVLDSQLQETIYQFEHKEGVVVRIKHEGVKSEQLVQALANRTPVIVVTLQTFPFVLEAIRRQTSLKQRTFAVIADEAHSSQTGSAASSLGRVLSSEQLQEGAEVSAEDLMLAEMESRSRRPCATSWPSAGTSASNATSTSPRWSPFRAKSSIRRAGRSRSTRSRLLEQQARTNTKEQFALGDFRKAMMGAIVSGLENYRSMAEQVPGNERVREGFASVVLDSVYEAFRGSTDTGGRGANSRDPVLWVRTGDHEIKS